MVKLFRGTLSLFTRQQKNVFSAATVIMLTVALSRILGLWRDRLLAARFSPSDLGVYYAAFRLPNMIFELLVMGALAAAFIPVFTSYLDTKGKKEAFMMASIVINIGSVIFLIISLPLVIFSRQVSSVLAPGFNQQQLDLMAVFSQIMMLAQVFPLIIGNFITGMLQSFRNFFISSLAPVVYNLGIIFAIIILSPVIGLYAPVVGVVIGAVLFALIQIPTIISYGYRHNWSFAYKHPGAREIGKLILPRTLGLAVTQIDTTIDLILSSLLGAGAVTIFNFAQHLQQLPIGLFGVSLAQASLPSLSLNFAQKNWPEFKKTFISSFHQILFLVMPLSVILIVLRIPIVRLVFGASTLFDWESTVTTGTTLAYFSFSLFAQSLVHLLARTFYAMHDTRTPVIVGAISVFLNTVLSVLMIIHYHLGVWSLGLTATIANLLNMLLLMIYLDKKIGYFSYRELFLPAGKIFLSSAVSGLALYIPLKLFDQLVFDTTRTINLIMLTGVSTFFGLSVYLFLAWFLEVPQIGLLRKLYKKIKKEPYQGVLIDTTAEAVNVQKSEI